MSKRKSSQPAPAQVSQHVTPPSLPQTPAARLSSAEIQDPHRQRLAIVYVRQSTPQQVMEHCKSEARQSALTDQAKALGWSGERIVEIDEDQGQIGKTAQDRAAFQRLLAEVTMEHVGLVLGLDMSRFACSSQDWYHLFELCGLFGSLLADEDGVYDPSDPKDRLLLGLKGILSELGAHIMRACLNRGSLNKAQRGELFLHMAIGYMRLPSESGRSPRPPSTPPTWKATIPPAISSNARGASAVPSHGSNSPLPATPPVTSSPRPP